MFAKIPIIRRFVYSVSTISFLISSVVLVFFALGYRFNRQAGVWIHSGTITLKSNPKKVNISLNGKEIDKKTYDLINDSYNLNGIKPGAYQLKITSPGFSSWEKEIQIHSGIATEFWNIVLTEENAPRKVLDVASPEFYQLFDGGKKIIYSSRAEGILKIFIYSEKTGSSIKIAEEPRNRKDALFLKEVSFSGDSKSAILKVQEGKAFFHYLLYIEDLEKNGANEQNFIYLNKEFLSKNIINGDPFSFTAFSGSPLEDPFLIQKPKVVTKKPSKQKEVIETEPIFPDNFSWLTNDRFFFLLGETLYSFVPKEQGIQKVLEGVKGYEFSGGKIFYVKAPSNLIFEADPEGTGVVQISENMIDQDQDAKTLSYQVSVYDNKRIALINSNKELYLLNENEKEHQTFKQLSSNCKGVHFSDDGKKVLYFSSDQIKVYYLREWEVQPKNDVGSDLLIYENKEQPIENAVWHKNYQHIIFSLPNTVNLIELDIRNKINKSLVAQSKVPEINFSCELNNETLYFLDLTERGAYLNQLVLPKR
jgi:hypothetical protein